MGDRFFLKTRTPTVAENGSVITYTLKPNTTPQSMQSIKDFFTPRILKNEQILSSPAGIYTWILKQDGQFYFAKPFTKQEIGTLHVNLDSLSSNPSPVFAAGEFQLTVEGNQSSKSVEFNLLSGTYMAPLFKKKTFQESIRLRDVFVSQVETLFSSYGIPSTFLYCSFESCSEEEKVGGMKLLDESYLPTSSENIAMLNSMFMRKKNVKGGSRKVRPSKKSKPSKKSRSSKKYKR